MGTFARRPDVDAVSVKVSSLVPWLNLLDVAGTVDRLTKGLRELCRVAREASPSTMVMLDMEEHRDLHLTLEVLRRLLEEREFDALDVGVALQAYLPDSHAVLDDLLTWARQRVDRGGTALRIQLVKGANLAMERVEAELHGWPPAPYERKADTDASYLRLLDRLLRPAHASFLRVGLGTHNLFDVAYGLVLAAARGMERRVEPEMLAGMAGREAAAVARSVGGVLLYVPVVSDREFHNSIAYLSRRLEENATPDGFLRHALELTPESGPWEAQRSLFLSAVQDRDSVRTTPHQTQDRSTPPPTADPELGHEPETDLSVPANRDWARHWLACPPDSAPVTDASVDDVEQAVAAAASAAWNTTRLSERSRVLVAAAEVMNSGRGAAIGVMSDETGKTFEEADPEVSEAVDYARWYANQLHVLDDVAGEAVFEPLGVVVVAPPWNFPFAIPANGVIAALAAGNCVVIKPSPEARRTCRVLVDQLHEAGVPMDALQMVAAPDGDVGRRLVTHGAVGGVLLTGSWDTARSFAQWRPGMRLLAETSGKNAVVVTATADVDQAVRDIVRSAFGHAGQKCSAASLAIVDTSVYDRSSFLPQLADAVSSIRVGKAADPSTQVGPIVGPLTDRLVRALTSIDPGESWLVAPRRLDESGRLWSLGVRLGVRPGSWAHMTEWFGPVLGVMRSPDLETAIRWQNEVPFGLTAGLESLDPDEQSTWAAAVQVGNLYINRPTTGAVPGRQPFGGWKRSSFGPTAKAGGPNYLLNLGRWHDVGPTSPNEVERSYGQWWDRCFAATRDTAGLTCEENTLRYLPLPRVVVRADPRLETGQLIRAHLAARVSGTPVEFSAPGPRGDAPLAITHEDVDRLASRLTEDIRLRVLGPPEPSLLQAAADVGVTVCLDTVSACGRVELPRWLREQVVTRTRHRYGTPVP